MFEIVWGDGFFFQIIFLKGKVKMKGIEMINLKRALNLVISMVFVFMVAACGTPHNEQSSGQISSKGYDDSIPEGTAMLQVIVPLPGAVSSTSRSRALVESEPLSFTGVKLVISGEDLPGPLSFDLQVEGSRAVNYQKIYIPASDSFMRKAVVTATSNKGTFESTPPVGFYSHSREIIEIKNFYMARVASENDPGVLQVDGFTWRWDVPATFQTISEAIAVAHAGDTIVVNGGTYAENIVLTEGIILQGRNGATIQGVNGSYFVVQGARNAQIDGFLVKGESDYYHAGIYIRGGMEVSNITTTLIEGDNLYVYADGEVLIHHCIMETTQPRITGTGLCIEGFASVFAYNNTIIGKHTGIGISSYNSTPLTCSIHDNLFVRCNRIINSYNGYQARGFSGSILNNIYDGASFECEFCEAFHEYGYDPNGVYFSRTLAVDSTNKEVDPMLENNCPTNLDVCNLGTGGTTPGAKPSALVIQLNAIPDVSFPYVVATGRALPGKLLYVSLWEKDATTYSWDAPKVVSENGTFSIEIPLEGWVDPGAMRLEVSYETAPDIKATVAFTYAPSTPN